MTMTIVMMMLMMLMMATTMINSDRRMQQLYEYVPAYVSTRNKWYCLQCYAVVLPFESGQSWKQLLLVKWTLIRLNYNVKGRFRYMFPKQHFAVVLRTLICEIGPVDKSLKKTKLFTRTLLSITLESWGAVTGSRNVFVRGPIPTVQPFTAALSLTRPIGKLYRSLPFTYKRVWV